MWSVNWFGVQHTTGATTAPAGSAESKPIKTSEIARSPVNKIIQGDWPWHGSRDPNSPKSFWHNNRGVRGWNMMYGDGHVALFRFPQNYGPNQLSTLPVSPTNAWW